MGFLPGRPDGNADRLHDGARAWEGLAHDLWVMENDLRARGPGSVHDWWRGPAADAYLGDWQRVDGGLGGVDRQLHAVAQALHDAAGQIESAQHTYDAIAAGIGLTTAVGIGLTVFTLGISDAAAGGADAAEVGGATAAIDVLGGAIRGCTGALEAVVAQLEMAMIRVTLVLGELPPVVAEAGYGAAVSTVTTLALGERDPAVLAMWGAAGATEAVADFGDETGIDTDRVADPGRRTANARGISTLSRPYAEPPKGEISLERAAAAASRNGVDMDRIELRYVAPNSPDYLPNTAGHTSFNGAMEPILNDKGQYIIYMQDSGLTSEREAYITIVHELGHISDPIAEEADVEAAAQAAGRSFIP